MNKNTVVWLRRRGVLAFYFFLPDALNILLGNFVGSELRIGSNIPQREKWDL